MLTFFAFMLRVFVMALAIGGSLNFVYTTIVNAIPDSTQPPADNGDDMDDGDTNGMDDNGDGDADTNGGPAECVEGESCDDGDPCTRSDQCVDGVCQGAPVVDCVLCETNADCDQGDNPCASGSCAEGACLIQNQVGPCDDGDECTDSDLCMNGECVGTAIPGCVDGETATGLTTIIRGDGSVIEDPANAEEPGQTVTLTAIAFGCAVFDHWEGALTGGDNPAAVVLEESTEVTAVFALDASANLTGDWVITRQVASASGDAGCTLPTVGSEDEVNAQLVAEQGVLSIDFAFDDLDTDGFAEGIPGGLFPIDGCPGDDAFGFAVDLPATTGLIETTSASDTIERCGCVYTSEAAWDVAFESCERVTGVETWTIIRECAEEATVECQVRYDVVAAPAEQ